jgi:hypothetical protein
MSLLSIDRGFQICIYSKGNIRYLGEMWSYWGKFLVMANKLDSGLPVRIVPLISALCLSIHKVVKKYVDSIVDN